MPREPRITEIDDEDVFQILTEIRERDGKAGVAFHQGIDRTARYPTKKVLALCYNRPPRANVIAIELVPIGFT